MKKSEILTDYKCLRICLTQNLRFMKSKLKSMFALVAICGLFAFVSNTKVEAKAGEVWLGITYVMAEYGDASNEATLAVGAIGVADAAVWGFAVGSVATPVAGAVAGAVAGL